MGEPGLTRPWVENYPENQLWVNKLPHLRHKLALPDVAVHEVMCPNQQAASQFTKHSSLQAHMDKYTWMPWMPDPLIWHAMRMHMDQPGIAGCWESHLKTRTH